MSSGAGRDPTTRFTDRVEAYQRYRPGYPREAVAACGFQPGATLLELGSGTGIFTALLLDAGFEVLAVEPNAAMRAVAEAALGAAPGFRSVAARAEATGLPGACAEALVCAQSFHWLDRAATRAEALRVLRPPRRAAIVYNQRVRAGEGFTADYHAAIARYAVDDPGGHHHGLTLADYAELFGHRELEVRAFEHAQQLDLEGLLGRAFSASYTPPEGHPSRAPLRAALAELFARYADPATGTLAFAYRCEVIRGEIR